LTTSKEFVGVLSFVAFDMDCGVMMLPVILDILVLAVVMVVLANTVERLVIDGESESRQ
jgi:hypothetical protein